MVEIGMASGVLALYVGFVLLGDAIKPVWTRIRGHRRAVAGRAAQVRYRGIAQKPEWLYEPHRPLPVRVRPAPGPQEVAHWKARRFFRRLPPVRDLNPVRLESKQVLAVLRRYPQASVRLVLDGTGGVRWAVGT